MLTFTGLIHHLDNIEHQHTVGRGAAPALESIKNSRRVIEQAFYEYEQARALDELEQERQEVVGRRPQAHAPNGVETETIETYDGHTEKRVISPNVIKSEDLKPWQVVDRVEKEIDRKAKSKDYDANTTREIERMEWDVIFYKAGLNGEIPEKWERFKKELDPEYQEFLRLEKKFGKDRVNRRRS